MEDFDEIKKEIELIKERNKRVEADKAWEISGTRVASVLLMTYIITAVVFYIIGVNNFLLNAIIPTLGFYLSTLSLPFIKSWQIKTIWKRK
jgi:hypothetical protein